MLIIYLVILWIILTAALGGYRRSAVLFLVWFLLTAVMLWPVMRRATPYVQAAYNSPLVQAVIEEGRTELASELKAEFPELYGEIESSTTQGAAK